jgi:hypothetical protein
MASVPRWNGDGNSVSEHVASRSVDTNSCPLRGQDRKSSNESKCFPFCAGGLNRSRQHFILNGMDGEFSNRRMITNIWRSPASFRSYRSAMAFSPHVLNHGGVLGLAEVAWIDTTSISLFRLPGCSRFAALPFGYSFGADGLRWPRLATTE